MADGHDEAVVSRRSLAGPPAPGEGGSPTPGRNDLLIRRSQETRTRARSVIRRSEHLHAVASARQRSAHAAVLASRPRKRYAVIEATLDDAPTFAIVRRDGSVVVDRRLRIRLDVLEALGDTLATGRPAVVGGDPLTSILTILRSCDGIRSVTFADGPSATSTG